MTGSVILWIFPLELAPRIIIFGFILTCSYVLRPEIFANMKLVRKMHFVAESDDKAPRFMLLYGLSRVHFYTVLGSMPIIVLQPSLTSCLIGLIENCHNTKNVLLFLKTLKMRKKSCKEYYYVQFYAAQKRPASCS